MRELQLRVQVEHFQHLKGNKFTLNNLIPIKNEYNSCDFRLRQFICYFSTILSEFLRKKVRKKSFSINCPKKNHFQFHYFFACSRQFQYIFACSRVCKSVPKFGIRKKFRRSRSMNNKTQNSQQRNTFRQVHHQNHFDAFNKKV